VASCKSRSVALSTFIFIKVWSSSIVCKMINTIYSKKHRISILYSTVKANKQKPSWLL
jgi:hypothetical protein